MSKYNAKDYEKVKQRKLRFFQEYPDGRIIPHLLNPESVFDHAVFCVSVYKSEEDQKNDLPLSKGYAHELRDKEMKTSNSGKQYESVNYSSWVENCEESAVGRALDNAGFASNLKCSREEIEKAKKQREVLEKVNNAQQMFWAVTKKLTDGYEDTNALTDIYKLLGLSGCDEAQKETDVEKINGWIQQLNRYNNKDKEHSPIV